jgi:hypothetical protein
VVKEEMGKDCGGGARLANEAMYESGSVGGAGGGGLCARACVGKGCQMDGSGGAPKPPMHASSSVQHQNNRVGMESGRACLLLGARQEMEHRGQECQEVGLRHIRYIEVQPFPWRRGGQRVQRWHAQREDADDAVPLLQGDEVLFVFVFFCKEGVGGWVEETEGVGGEDCVDGPLYCMLASLAFDVLFHLCVYIPGSLLEVPDRWAAARRRHGLKRRGRRPMQPLVEAAAGPPPSGD